MTKTMHDRDDLIVRKVEWLFHVIPLNKLRETNKVTFELVPSFNNIDAVDIVTHQPWARSPWSVWDKDNLWYMHNGQEDNLVTFSGTRFVELYNKEHWVIEKFEVSHAQIKWNGEVILDRAGILGWPTWVFHRPYSPEWSVSMNFAVRNDTFDIDTEFNIYDVDTTTGAYEVVRLGKLDQPNQ